MSIRVGPGTRVTLAYTLKTDRGDLLEERTPENPFIFEFGKGQTLPAIENVVRGRTEGFESSLGVAAKEAYGIFDDELVASVPLSTFPASSDVQVGMKYSTKGPLGEEITVRVVAVDLADGTATVDGNHPLAGVDVEIDLRILSVEQIEASEDSELDPDLGHDTKTNTTFKVDDDDDSSGGRILH